MSEVDDLKLTILELHEALIPFRLYANCVENMKPMEPVVKTGAQALVASAFSHAKEVHEKYKPLVQGYYDQGLESP
jgi:hypothetical protein